jgi:hypothetical protein
METMKEFQMIDKKELEFIQLEKRVSNNFTAISGAAALSLKQGIRYHANLVKLIN